MRRRRWLLAFAACAALLSLLVFMSVPREGVGLRQEEIADESKEVVRSPSIPVADTSESAAFGAVAPASASHVTRVDGPKILSPIPAEWEDALASILLERQPIEAQNLRLLELATRQAADVPRVQQECLMHLAFSLSDKDPETFFVLCSSQNIPAELRREFLDRVLAIRPTTLCVPLCERILQLGDFGLAAIAQDYLETAAAEGASR
jgi:hypothetical protein